MGRIWMGVGQVEKVFLKLYVVGYHSRLVVDHMDTHALVFTGDITRSSRPFKVPLQINSARLARKHN
jgi:hypothetical protein